MKELQMVADDIISLKIQGATAVAVEGIKAMRSFAERLPTLKTEVFIENMEKARDVLINTRPTEPAL